MNTIHVEIASRVLGEPKGEQVRLLRQLGKDEYLMELQIPGFKGHRKISAYNETPKKPVQDCTILKIFPRL